MKKIKKILILVLKGLLTIVLLLVLILALSIPYGRSSEKDMIELGVNYKKIVIKGVNVLPMETEEILYNQNIYIDNGIIKNIISDTIPLLIGFEVIEAKGKYVLPGLIDMHSHIFDRADLPQYLSYGVTTVRNMMGFPMHIRWKEQLKQNKLIGSNLITSTPTINSGDGNGPFHKNIDNADEVKTIVNEYIDQGYDFIKVYDGLDSLLLKEVEEIAKLKNVQIAGHPPKISLKGLLNSSIVSIEHTEELLQFLDKEKSEESMRVLARQLKASNKAVTLNLIAFYRIHRVSHEGDSSYYKDLQEQSINPVVKFTGTKELGSYIKAGPKYKAYTETKYLAMKNLSRILVEEGVTVLFGTDTGPNFIAPGVSVLQEMKLLEDAGISRFEILKSATLNAAEILNDKSLGKVAVNATANLLVLDGNPIENLDALLNPDMLFLNAKYYSSKDLLSIRKLGEDKQSIYATIGLILEHLINK